MTARANRVKKPTAPPLTQAPARKALGQHFLFDPDILSRTAIAAGPVEGRTVIEVGPGPGGLTRALLNANAKKVIAIETDPRFAEALTNWPEASSARLRVLQKDALKVDYAGLVEEEDKSSPVMIIANLPYNVATPLLVNWLKAGDWRGEMALMFQKEVALRICARPGEPHYGRLAVLAQSVAQTHIAFTLPPGAFKPPPKVDSAVAVLVPKEKTDQFTDLKTLEAVTAAAFGQRRKMLRRSLKAFAAARNTDVETWLTCADIEPTARAETIDQSGWQRLVREITKP